MTLVAHLLDVLTNCQPGVASLRGADRIRHTPDEQGGALDLAAMTKQRFDLRQHIEQLNVELFRRVSRLDLVVV